MAQHLKGNIFTIGDVHAGRKFIENVPLARRGEREKLVLSQFFDELTEAGEVTVQVGDLFDAFKVDNETLLSVYESIRDVSESHPNRDYVFLRGNHDAAREINLVSSFDILATMCSALENVYFLTEAQVLVLGQYRLGFLPWNPFLSAKQLAEGLIAQDKDSGQKLYAVFCHCDLKPFGEDTFNVLPVTKLSEVTSTIVTGHIHKKQHYTVGKTDVVVTGSMQPYSHGEWDETDLYITIAYKDYLQVPETFWKDRYVRVLVEADQRLEEIPNCLGFTYKTVAAVESGGDEVEEMSEVMDSFDTRAILQGCLGDEAVSEEVTAQVLEKFDAAFTVDQ